MKSSSTSSEEKREHVELFINSLGAQEQELASRLTLMEVPATTTLEKKLRARQRGLAHQKKTLFGSNRFRQKASTLTPTPTRAVHAVQIATDDYDSEGAEVSILDTTFAREVGCQIDTSVTQECVGIRDETYFTVGKTRVKVTLAGNMMYYMDLWSTDAVKARDALSPKLEHGKRLGTEHKHGPDSGVEPEHGPHLKMGSTEEPDPNFKEIPEYEYADEEVIFHEGSDLFAEDVEAEMAVLPEVPLTAEVKISDLKIGRPEGVDPEEAAEMEERLRQIVWKKRKWLIGKGNALPPAAKGVICDIDVGNARPVAQRVRKISSHFREKLADLIRGLLSA
ncbi:Eukaryotic/viral aspartic protease, partial [Phytophthora megakarya]